MNYTFYMRTDKGTTAVAELRGGRFYGEQSKMIYKLLKKNGYPKKSPDKILHGSRLWAQLTKPGLVQGTN
jgi:hypothetical protein